MTFHTPLCNESAHSAVPYKSTALCAPVFKNLPDSIGRRNVLKSNVEKHHYFYLSIFTRFAGDLFMKINLYVKCNRNFKKYLKIGSDKIIYRLKWYSFLFSFNNVKNLYIPACSHDMFKGLPPVFKSFVYETCWGCQLANQNWWPGYHSTLPERYTDVPAIRLLKTELLIRESIIFFYIIKTHEERALSESINYQIWTCLWWEQAWKRDCTFRIYFLPIMPKNQNRAWWN